MVLTTERWLEEKDVMQLVLDRRMMLKPCLTVSRRSPTTPSCFLCLRSVSCTAIVAYLGWLCFHLEHDITRVRACVRARVCVCVCSQKTRCALATFRRHARFITMLCRMCALHYARYTDGTSKVHKKIRQHHNVRQHHNSCPLACRI